MPDATSRVSVDDRWSIGHHGIARYSRELLLRLSLPSAGLHGSPTAARDVINPGRLRFGSSDLIYSPGFNAGATSARQLLTIHDLIHLDDSAERSTAKSAYYRFVVKPTIRRVGHVLTVSGTSKQRIERWLNDDSVTVHNAGNGCSEAFNATGGREDFSLPTFVFVGGSKPHKNLVSVLGALVERPSYRMVVITGDNNVQTLVKQFGVSPQVSIRTGLSDDALARLYRGSDGLLLPSTSEGFGLPAAESLRCGTRVAFAGVCTPVAEIVGSSGVSVEDATSTSEWAGAMDTLLSGDTALSPSESLRVNEYAWEHVAGRVAGAIEAIR